MQGLYNIEQICISPTYFPRTKSIHPVIAIKSAITTPGHGGAVQKLGSRDFTRIGIPEQPGGFFYAYQQMKGHL